MSYEFSRGTRRLFWLILILVLLSPAGWGESVKDVEVGPPPAGDLAGKRLVYREYRGDADSESSYVGGELTISRSGATLPNTPDSWYICVAADQTDPEVARQLGKAVWVFWPGEVCQLTELPRQTIPITDALGNPLDVKRMTVTLLIDVGPAPNFRDRKVLDRPEVRRIQLDAAILSASGPGELPLVVNGKWLLTGFLLHHPGLGTALSFNVAVQLGSSVPGRESIILPLVAKGTPARERALHGQVLDADGQPLADAVVDCHFVRTLGGGSINGAAASAVTDVQGNFLLYQPDVSTTSIQMAGLIPPESRFLISVTPPATAPDLFPWAGEGRNMQPAKVQLFRGDAMHTFTFETVRGQFTPTSPGNPMKVSYRLAGDGSYFSPISLPESLAERGGKVPYGTYYAKSIEPRDKRHVDFAPITIGPDSPSEVVFRLPQRRNLTGRVLNGVTGEPMAGACVVVMGIVNGRNLTDLTAEDWEELHGLAQRTEIDGGEEVLRRLHEMYRYFSLTRTDAEGRWTLTDSAAVPAHAIVVFDKDYLGIRVLVHMLKADADGAVTVSDVKLWPAARVTITPKVSVTPRWVIDPEGNPPWSAEMSDWVRGQNYDRYFEFGGWRMKAGKPTTIAVPADVHCRVRLVSEHEDFGEKLIETPIYLRQGQTLDLGEAALPENQMVAVQVVDETGMPLEGIPLRIKVPARGWGIGRNSDQNGGAIFIVPPGETREVGVTARYVDGKQFKAVTTQVKASGDETAPAIFKLTLDAATVERVRRDPR